MFSNFDTGPVGAQPLLGGVCARLARATDTPVWLWRIGFILAAHAGLVAYLLLWVVLSHQHLKDVLHRVHRAAVGGWIAGICRGLADATDTPAWVWRLAFVLGLHAGVIIYVLLWVFMPKAARQI
jgi:phage shock protein PspC (stress-responsive transcriptional regulator)